VARGIRLDFNGALAAANRFVAAGTAIHERQLTPPANVKSLNRALRTTEQALLLPAGLPRRPWYRHAIYAPGEFTGYAAVVIPGVNEGIDALDTERSQTQLDVLAQALDRAAAALNTALVSPLPSSN